MMNESGDHARNKFRRQHRVDGFILDLFRPAIALGVEVDGHTHDPDDDRVRDACLHHQQGITVIRVSNIDVMTNMEGVLSAILAAASTQPSRWPERGVLHPNPSFEEEGL